MKGKMLITSVAALSAIAFFGCQQQQAPKPETKTSTATLEITAPTTKTTEATLEITAPTQEGTGTTTMEKKPEAKDVFMLENK